MASWRTCESWAVVGEGRVGLTLPCFFPFLDRFGLSYTSSHTTRRLHRRQPRPERRNRHDCVCPFLLVPRLFRPLTRVFIAQYDLARRVATICSVRAAVAVADPPESRRMVKAFSPDFVAPVVGYLGSEANQDTMGLYEVSAGWVASIRWQRTAGHAVSSTFPSSIRGGPS